MTALEVLEAARRLLLRGYRYPFPRDADGRAAPLGSTTAASYDVESALIAAAGEDAPALLAAWALVDAAAGGSLLLWEMEGRTHHEVLALVGSVARRAARAAGGGP